MDTPHTQSPSQNETPATVIRFMTEQAALRTLESFRLRIGRISEMNDPFEWSIGSESVNPAILEELGHTSALANLVESQNQTTFHKRFWREGRGFISFCHPDKRACPLMWSHYADAHRGIMLEFQTSGDPFAKVQKVDYDQARPHIKADEMKSLTVSASSKLVELGDKIALRKSPAWKHEQEYRLVLDLFDKPKDVKVTSEGYFLPFTGVDLKQVVLGYRSRVPYTLLQGLLSQHEESHKVELQRMRMEQTTWDLFEEQLQPGDR